MINLILVFVLGLLLGSIVTIFKAKKYQQYLENEIKRWDLTRLSQIRKKLMEVQ